MRIKKSKPEHEYDRTEILRLLNERQLIPIHPKKLVYLMDVLDHHVSLEGMYYHLRYMRDQGWVQLGEQRIVGEEADIVWARITADGVDELDRRAAKLGEKSA